MATFPYQGAEWTGDCHVIEEAFQESDFVPFPGSPFPDSPFWDGTETVRSSEGAFWGTGEEGVAP